MRRKKENKGFSLLELLATIFIISLVLGITGYFVMNTINNSEEKSNVVAINNIKNTADIYTKEYPNDIMWDNNKACVPIQELINKGYLKEEEVSKNTDKEYIILTRDENHNIISNELDNNGSCSVTSKKISIPTASKYCSSLSYNGVKQNLININQISNSEQLTFQNNEQTNAGNYDINISLVEGSEYVWSDGSKDQKTITCTIKKTIPELKLPPEFSNGEDGNNLEDTHLTLYSNIQGIFRVKSSNKEYATASVEKTSTQKNARGYYETPATIQKLGKREANTYITFTISPTSEEDKKNYYSGTFVYTIGKVDKISINVPTCKSPIYYTGKEQTLVDSGQGYVLWNEKAIEEGIHPVTIQLKYGYTWEDDSTETKTKECEIQKARPYVTYMTNGGTTCNPQKKQVTYNFAYGTLCSTTKTGYTFAGWYNAQSDGNLVNSSTIVTNLNDHNIYARWTANQYTITYDANGGNACSPTTKKVTYDSTYGTLCTPTRTGYTFAGWYTAKTGGSIITTSTTVKTANDHTIYARWTANTYMITYKDNGGTGGPGTQNFVFNSGAKISTTKPTRTGYTFSHWTYSGNNFAPGADIPTDWGSFTLTAQWTANTYTITYDSNGGNACSPTTKKVTYDSTYGTLCTPTRTGYTFAGWYTAKSGGNKVTTSTKVSTAKNHTIYARWTANQYTITYDANGGNACSPTTKKVTYDSTYGTLCTPTRTGYTFTGWYTAKSGGNKVTTSTKVSTAKNHTIYAIWRINVCTINYKPNGGKFNSNASNTTQKMNYGASTSNMRNATGSSGYYNAKRSDEYNKAVSGKEWIKSDGTTFNQANGYNATNFCPNLANGDQTVNLYVNWYDTKYRKRTCKSCKNCVTSTTTTCSSGYNQCTYGCVQNESSSSSTSYYTNTTCKIPNANWCWFVSEDYICTSYKTTNNYSTSCSSCGCKTWNSWSTYKYDSCSAVTNKTQCESKKVYPDPRFQ